jgi:hypothetical protein
MGRFLISKVPLCRRGSWVWGGTESVTPWGGSELSIEAQLFYRNVQWFRGGLVFKAHKLFITELKDQE